MNKIVTIFLIFISLSLNAQKQKANQYLYWVDFGINKLSNPSKSNVSYHTALNLQIYRSSFFELGYQYSNNLLSELFIGTGFIINHNSLLMHPKICFSKIQEADHFAILGNELFGFKIGTDLMFAFPNFGWGLNFNYTLNSEYLELGFKISVGRLYNKK